MTDGGTAVSFDRVDVVYGASQARARVLRANGADADALRREGYVAGVLDASLEVARGEICVLMGRSGCGKSSLLRSVNGLAPITRGRVLVQDGARRVDVGATDARTIRRLRGARVAMVFQDVALLPWRTVRENAELPLELCGMRRDERARRARGALGLVGLGDWMDAYPHELSGGMQQRVGLARAYVTDADILLMDEPFSALDPLLRGRLQDELLTLQHAAPRTILFVTHDVGEALRLATRIAILEAGRIVQTGTPEDLALRPATAYVREFLAGINPLVVLRASAVMRPLAPSPGMRLELDGRRLELDADGRLAGDAAAHVVAPHTPLADVVAARAEAGEPVLVAGRDGRLVGVVDTAEILRALAHHASGTPPGR